jgi:cell division protein FtsB
VRPEGATKLKKILVVLALGMAGLFALLGGEYTTFDLFRMKDQLRDEQEAITRLKIEVDSLEAVARAVERDPRTQERLARDQFGMIREGEHLYRIVPAGDSAR